MSAGAESPNEAVAEEQAGTSRALSALAYVLAILLVCASLAQLAIVIGVL